MRTKTTNCPIEGELFTPEEMGVTCGSNGSNAKSFNLRDYLHSRDGLWRLITCMPGSMSVVEALRLAPSVIFGLRVQEKGGAL